MRNLHHRFDRYYIGQIYGGCFTKFCGLLRICKLFWIDSSNIISLFQTFHCAAFVCWTRSLQIKLEAFINNSEFFPHYNFTRFLFLIPIFSFTVQRLCTELTELDHSSSQINLNYLTITISRYFFFSFLVAVSFFPSNIIEKCQIFHCAACVCTELAPSPLFFFAGSNINSKLNVIQARTFTLYY